MERYLTVNVIYQRDLSNEIRMREAMHDDLTKRSWMRSWMTKWIEYIHNKVKES